MSPDDRSPTEGDSIIDEMREGGAATDESAPAAPASTDAAAMRDKWLRAEADLQNFRRRSARDLDDARRSAEERVLLELIDYLDDLERAVGAAKSAKVDAMWVQGVELVAQRMRDGLARAGVDPVNPAGEPFDPNFHEALMQMPAAPGVAPGTVTHVERTGYRRGDRVLRPARVAVAADTHGAG
jgi:molecular chaperone GrpE